MIKNNKGVTLLALIITVVVMLILTGITVNLSYTSVSKIRSNKLEADLQIVRQAVVERYQMARTANKLHVNKNDEQISFWVGKQIEASKISLPSYKDGEEILGLNNFKTQIEANTIQYQEDYYYRLTKEDLKSLGIEDNKYTYVVNYKTAEVYNETRKVTSEGKLLYLGPIVYNEGEDNTEDTTSFKDWNPNE